MDLHRGIRPGGELGHKTPGTNLAAGKNTLGNSNPWHQQPNHNLNTRRATISKRFSTNNSAAPMMAALKAAS